MKSSIYIELVRKALYHTDTMSEKEKKEYDYLLQTNEEVKQLAAEMIAEHVKAKMKFEKSPEYATFKRMLANTTAKYFKQEKKYTLNEILAECGLVLSEEEKRGLFAPHKREDAMVGRRGEVPELRTTNEPPPKETNNLLELAIKSPTNGDDCTGGIQISLRTPLNFSLKIDIQDNKLNPTKSIEMPPQSTEAKIELDTKKTLPGRYYCEITPDTKDSNYTPVIKMFFVRKDLDPNAP